MTYIHMPLSDNETDLPKLPAWAGTRRGDDFEELAFRSGAVLSVLDAALRRKEVPLALLRDRLALKAAEACVVHAGRPERAATLRDEVHLLRKGEQPGPAGAILARWRLAVGRPVSVGLLNQAVPEVMADQGQLWQDGQGNSPVAQASVILQEALLAVPQEESVALILADAALARGLGWSHILPLFALGLTRRDLRCNGDSLRLACHRALVIAAEEVLRLAADLSRRRARLQAVAPKLRAKTAAAAVQLFLSTDVLAPSIALTAPAVGMTDRAARRLCDRLVELGAVRELTGRATFRLYGL